MQSVPAEESRRPLAVVILAAGQGTRMKSKTPKVLHRICGRPMIVWITEAAAVLEPDRILVVLGSEMDTVHQHLPQSVELVMQERQLGTGDAVRSCDEALAGFEGDILVMYGDTPLVTAAELGDLVATHADSETACTMMTVAVDDPTHYGRVCRDEGGHVIRIVEERDADDQERLIREVNAGVYVFNAPALWPALAEVDSENAQGEIYLTDVIGIMAAGGEMIQGQQVGDPSVVLGVNSRLDLALATEIIRRRILEEHMLDGVTIVDPGSTYVDAGVQIGRDSTIEPMTVLAGDTTVGEDCVIGPSATVVDSHIDDGVNLISSYVTGADIAEGCSIGPFAYLRPGTRLDAGAKAGSFVEIKNSYLGEGSKVPHLSYIGDAEIGSGTNIGAGNITANYDGVNKHRTQIGSGVQTGANTVFVAPVKTGDGSMTGAGSVITSDIPGGSLGISRSKQKNVDGYASKKMSSREEQ